MDRACPVYLPVNYHKIFQPALLLGTSFHLSSYNFEA